MPTPEEKLFPTTKERFEDRRKERQHRDLQEEFFDHPTLLSVSRLISHGDFASIDYPISKGKEGGVFRATAGEGFRAVKVYRIGNTVFRSLPPYVVEEIRREASRHNFSRLVYAWTRREHTILGRLTDCGVRVPHPYAHYRNVLVMEFIGTPEGIAAPRLNESVVPEPEAVLADLTVQIRRMSHDAHLVHGDLSPYNILLHDGSPVLIDVAQAIPAEHPQARGLLERDLKTLSRYFARRCAVPAFEELWSSVGGASIGPKEAA
jgi:RIO kinase 1